jgi:hypothetical protein
VKKNEGRNEGKKEGREGGRKEEKEKQKKRIWDLFKHKLNSFLLSNSVLCGYH